MRLFAEHLEPLQQLGHFAGGRVRRRLSGPRIGKTRIAPTSTSAPISRKTQPGPQAAISSPATAGAMRTLMLSIHPDTTLAAVSSSGTLARAGTSVATVGRVTTIAVAATAAAVYASHGGPPRISTAAVAPMAMPCAT